MGNAVSTKQNLQNLADAAASQQQSSPQSNPTEPNNLTCEICIEPMLLPNRLLFNSGRTTCRHPFCTECIIKYIQAKLEDNVAKIPCPALNCPQFLDPLSCRGVVGRELFVRWCDSLCEAYLMGFSDWSYCPNINCSTLILNECGGGNIVKRTVCPNCKIPFCFNCKLPWHAGFRCEESREVRDQNDRAFGVLAEQRKWMRCPKCRHFVERIQGCTHIQCRCHANFCYTCGELSCKCNRITMMDEQCRSQGT